jgi:hypothetical protein
MAQWVGHSNQKLYQARLLLDCLDQTESSDSNQADLISGLQEAVVFQLILAYQSYLHEIAEIAQCNQEFYSLAQLLDIVKVATGEMTELKQLEEDGFSWLSQLQSAFKNCSAKEPAAIKPEINPVMIKMQDTLAVSMPLRVWYDSLSELIDLQRNNRQES